jgi:hypothetical protein
MKAPSPRKWNDKNSALSRKEEAADAQQTHPKAILPSMTNHQSSKGSIGYVGHRFILLPFAPTWKSRT